MEDFERIPPEEQQFENEIPEMPTGNTTIDTGNAVIGWFEKMLRLIKQYGVFNTLRGFFITIVFIVVMFFILFPKKAISTIKDLLNEIHIEQVIERQQRDPEIRLNLKALRLDIDSRSTTMYEFHNSITNFSGLPFRFAQFSNEDLADTVQSFSGMFNDINLSTLCIITDLTNEGYVQGQVDSVLYYKDKMLYNILKTIDATYYSMVLIQGKDVPLGAVIAIWDHIPNDNIEAIMRTYSFRLSLNLTL